MPGSPPGDEKLTRDDWYCTSPLIAKIIVFTHDQGHCQSNGNPSFYKARGLKITSTSTRFTRRREACGGFMGHTVSSHVDYVSTYTATLMRSGAPPRAPPTSTSIQSTKPLERDPSTPAQSRNDSRHALNLAASPLLSPPTYTPTTVRPRTPPQYQPGNHRNAPLPPADPTHEDLMYSSFAFLSSLVLVAPLILLSCICLTNFTSAFGGTFGVCFLLSTSVCSFFIYCDSHNLERRECLALGARCVTWCLIWSIVAGYVWGMAVVWWESLPIGGEVMDDRLWAGNETV
jgi:hypothetical protein